jgi:hypothetical protein
MYQHMTGEDDPRCASSQGGSVVLRLNGSHKGAQALNALRRTLEPGSAARAPRTQMAGASHAQLGEGLLSPTFEAVTGSTDAPSEGLGTFLGGTHCPALRALLHQHCTYHEPGLPTLALPAHTARSASSLAMPIRTAPSRRV